MRVAEPAPASAVRHPAATGRVSAFGLAVLAAVLVGSGVDAQDDDALRVAAEISALVETFPSFRDEHPHGTWAERREATWSVRASAACHASLEALAVPFALGPATTLGLPIPAPVRLEGTIAGVTFRRARQRRPIIVACELASRLAPIAELLAGHDVDEVVVLSAWRRAPRTSFHTMGLALDLRAFRRTDGSTLEVETDYVVADDAPTCEGVPPLDEHAAALRAIACDLARSGLVSTVLTPAYSAGHRDHFHVDIRPEDPRIYVR